MSLHCLTSIPLRTSIQIEIPSFGILSYYMKIPKGEPCQPKFDGAHVLAGLGRVNR